MAVDVHVVEIPRFIQTIPAQVGVDPSLGDLLGRDMDHELLQLLVPKNVDQGFKFRCFVHVATEEGDDLLEQALGNQGEGRGEPGPDA